MNKMTALRQALVDSIPLGRRFTPSDMYRTLANTWTVVVPPHTLKGRVSQMLAQMANAKQIVRDGRGMYHKPAGQVRPTSLPNARYARVLNSTSWEGLVTPKGLVKDGVVGSLTYASIVLADLVKQGKIVRVKSGYYTRKGSSLDRSTPKRGPAVAVDPFS